MERLEQVRALLRRLDGATADELESETVEFKSWDPDPKAAKGQLRALRESVVCLANQRGGTLVVGVREKKRTREQAIRSVGELDPERVRREVYRGTEPPILVDVARLDESEGTLLVVFVPRGIPPHSTTEGVTKIRVGKECRPLTGPALTRALLTRGGVDLTAEVVPGATRDDIDAEQVRLLTRHLADAGTPNLATRGDVEMLESLGLLRDGGVTLAAVLIAGRSTALSRFASAHEVIFCRYRTPTDYDVRQEWRGPLLFVLDALRRVLEAHLRMATIAGQGFGEIVVPDMTWRTAREAVLNALVHRDFFLHQSVYVSLFPDRLEVSSPGGFLGGVTPENVLHHPPVRRNPLLAEVFQAIGFINRQGLGVDRMYDEMLRLGKAAPRYESDEAHVHLTLSLRTHAPFARFVAAETRDGRRPELDDLIVLRSVTDRGQLDRWSAASVLQRPEDEAAQRLMALRERGLLVPHGRGKGTSYRLIPALSDSLRGTHATDDDLPLDQGAVALKVRAVLQERGRLTNADLRRLTGYSRPAVFRLMSGLRAEGVAQLEGRGRGAVWVPGPSLPAARSRRRKRK